MENGLGTMAKMLIGTGLTLLVLGLLIWIFTKIPGFKGLPGDFVVKRENFAFYFPMATSLLISILLTLAFYIWRKMGG